MMQNTKKYLILGSSIALGVYVPALTLKKELEEIGHEADFVCLEDLYTGKNEVIAKTKKSFHENFRLARISYRMPAKNTDVLDHEKKARLFHSIEETHYDTIVTFSGFWVSLLEELTEVYPHYAERTAAIHMDADYSLSWKRVKQHGLREIWMYNLSQNRVLCSLGPVFDHRIDGDRILVHGGGWGIGEYGDKIRTLNELGFRLDIIVYYKNEADPADNINRYYLLDPDWKQDEKKWEFPRILNYVDGKWTELSSCSKKRNPLAVLIENCSAILSKPGGGTLADSLACATPLIFAEELAYYERSNRDLWVSQGFGIDYETFISEKDPRRVLMDMHDKISACRETISSVTELL